MTALARVAMFAGMRDKLTASQVKAIKRLVADEVARALASVADGKPFRAMSARQVCGAMNWSEATLYRKVAEGKFPAPVSFEHVGSKSQWNDRLVLAVQKGVWRPGDEEEIA